MSARRGPLGVAVGSSRAPGWRRDLRLALDRWRRVLAAGLVAGSVAVGLSAVAPEPPPTVAVLTAARDLVAGARVEAGDVRRSALPVGAVPAGALRGAGEVTGRVLAGPVRTGEVLTDVRLVGPALLSGHGSGTVATPVRIADAESARLLQPGDVVDVLAADPPVDPSAGGGASGEARLVAAGVRVIVAPRGDDGAFASGDLGEGALVVVATSEVTAARLAAAAVTSRLSLTIRAS